MLKIKQNVKPKKDDILEKEIEKTVIAYARSIGYYVRKFVSPSNRSVPDDLFLSPKGRIFFVEFKRKGHKPTAAQMNEHVEIGKRGGKVFVIDDIDKGKKLVDQFSKL